MANARKTVVLSNSGIGTLQTCKRLYHLKYNRNLEQMEKPVYFKIGGAFHTGVEFYRGDFTLAESIAEAKACLDDVDHQVMVSAMLTAWETHTKNFYKGYEVVDVEMEFELKYAHGAVTDYYFAGVVDALVKDSAGRVFILENKTTSDTIERFGSRLWAQRQGLLYNWALRRLGHPIAGIIYDVTKKPAMKRKLATPTEKRKYKKPDKNGELKLYAGQREHDESAGAYHQRILELYSERSADYFAQEVIVHTPAQLESIDTDFKDILNELMFCERTGTWPRSLTACYAWNRSCEFQPYCGAGNDEVILQTLFKERKRVFDNLLQNGGEEK